MRLQKTLMMLEKLEREGMGVCILAYWETGYDTHVGLLLFLHLFSLSSIQNNDLLSFPKTKHVFISISGSCY